MVTGAAARARPSLEHEDNEMMRPYEVLPAT
jgi:hypothetical protein